MIVTERLLMRRWHDGDRDAFAAMGQDTEVMHHFPGLRDRADSDRSIDRRNAEIDAKGYGLWAIERRADGVFLGFTGLSAVDLTGPLEGEIEIGWRLPRHAWGAGYAFEAARAALAFGWTRSMPRIFAMTAPSNERSWRLMTRLGMTRRTELDFAHPEIAVENPMRAQIVYAIDAP